MSISMNGSNLKLLIVDDDANLTAAMQRALRNDFEVICAANSTQGLEALGQNPDIVLLDIRLDESENTTGVQLLKELRRLRPEIPILMISAYGDMDTAIECMRLGAVDFVKKPADIKELRQRLNRAVENARVSRKVAQLEERLRQIEPLELIGETPAMLEAKRLIQLVAQDGYVTVLITGETGTGKEMVARAIHRNGWRAAEPFVPVAISSLNPSIIESELFGHEAGAFTDAKEKRIGFIEKARGGVLFLDEIGDLPEQLQLKLLRFLEDRSFTRAGSTHEIKVDVQIVAATNRDLIQAVAEGRIRKDFYYRLRSVEISLPPLRERLNDLPALARHLLCLFVRQGRTRVSDIEDEAFEVLKQFSWPGNVRELKAALERAVIYANQRGQTRIRKDDLPLDVLRAPETKACEFVRTTMVAGKTTVDLDLEVARTELFYVEDALKKSGERKSEAWRLLDLNDRFALRRRVLALLGKYPELAGEYPTTAKLYGKDCGTTGT
ncbi:MAG: sigma-54 dependent transcriptional regulator [Candidatus Eisenbacteria bacterium]|nr:sigma-54 dependent transcriptional regulator [Candidatus Eisenbacteria bacterium]